MKESLPKSNMGNTLVYIEGIPNDVMGVPVKSSVGETPLDTWEQVYLALKAHLDFLYYIFKTVGTSAIHICSSLPIVINHLMTHQIWENCIVCHQKI